MTAPRAAIVYGPPGTGKTSHAIKLARALRCDFIVDEWQPTDPVRTGALHLTSATKDELPLIRLRQLARVLPIDSAHKLARKRLGRGKANDGLR